MASKRVKKRTFSGSVCEQQVFSVSVRVKDLESATPPKPKEMTEEEKAEHKNRISLKRFVRIVNATFSPSSIYSTLTFNRECEVHTFWEARKIRENYRRRLIRAYPEAKIVIVMGRGKHTNRIHFHMLSDGIPKETIIEKWNDGEIVEAKNLRAHNYYKDQAGNWIDHGQDYTALATYLHNHWTQEQGGHRWMATKNMIEPSVEATKAIKRNYTPEKPPKAPKGYIYVGYESTEYNCTTYIYVVDPGPDPQRKKKQRTVDAIYKR